MLLAEWIAPFRRTAERLANKPHQASQAERDTDEILRLMQSGLSERACPQLMTLKAQEK
jgi:hypothetical protein